MLIATIPVKTYDSAKQHVFQLSERADGIELRLDYATYWDREEVAALRSICVLPVIFTLRSRAHGGYYSHAEDQRLQTILDLCALNPDYLDLEYDVSAQYLQTIRQRYPGLKIILSYHNFQKTPANLSDLFQTIYQPDC